VLLHLTIEGINPNGTLPGENQHLNEDDTF